VKRGFEITVRGPWLYSPKDKEVFFGWLESIPSVAKVGGVGFDVTISLRSKRVSQQDLRELIAILYRYRMNMRVLAPLASSRHPWFTDKKKFWYKRVFGTSQMDVKGKRSRPQ
jgi:hypothetical protein